MLWDASQAFGSRWLILIPISIANALAANGRYDQQVKAALNNDPIPAPAPSSTAVRSSTSAKQTTSTVSSHSTAPSPTATGTSSCGVVAAWMANIAYEGGSMVTYKYVLHIVYISSHTNNCFTFSGHLWTANWWSFADVPGGASGDWKDDGPCASVRVAKTNYRTVSAHASIPATASPAPTPKLRFSRERTTAQ
jgi:chitinase